jgi:pimeloyl-ACP methyl ester carboxylesterase
MLLQNKERLEDKWFIVEGLNLHTVFVANRSVKNSLPIVLVSGLGVSSSYMIPSALKLAEKADVYCPDLPGFGQSSKPRVILNISELAVALAVVLEQNKIQRAVVVGHSFGSQIAVEFALRYPEKLERLVLAAPTGDSEINSVFPYFLRFLRNLPKEPISLVPLAIRDYLKAGLIRLWRTFKFSLQDSFEDKLSRVQTPTLVIRGAKDPIVSPRWTERMTEVLPQGKLVNIQGAAHAVNYNSPDEFTRAIQEFLI